MRLIDFMSRRIRKDSAPDINKINRNNYYFAFDLYELFETIIKKVVYNKIFSHLLIILVHYFHFLIKYLLLLNLCLITRKIIMKQKLIQ
jgi:hypothetical protein